MTLKERIARALHNYEWSDNGILPEWVISWEEQDREEYALYRARKLKQAQAVLEAMLPEDDGSINAGVIRDFIKAAIAER